MVDPKDPPIGNGEDGPEDEDTEDSDNGEEDKEE